MTTAQTTDSTEGADLETDSTEGTDLEGTEAETVAGEGDTFTREYVTGLRREAAQHRTRATESAAARDALAAELWAARVESLGRLVDPADLPMPADLEAPTLEAVTEAVDALLEAKPHLAVRRVTGSVGQAAGSAAPLVSLSTMLRQGT